MSIERDDETPPPARARPRPVGARTLERLSMSGPLVLGIAVPVASFFASRSREVGWLMAASGALTFGGYAAVWALWSFALHRAAGEPWALRDAAPTSIAAALREAQDKEAVVEGIVAAGPDGTVEAPLTGRDCVWAEVFYLSTKPGRRGRSIARTSETAVARTFFLRGEDGAQIAVDPRGGELTAPSVGQEGIVEGAYAHRLERWTTEARLRDEEEGSGTERALRVGDRVRVHGTLRHFDARGPLQGHAVALVTTPSCKLRVTCETRAQMRSAQRRRRPLVSAAAAVTLLSLGVYALVRIVIHR